MKRKRGGQVVPIQKRFWKYVDIKESCWQWVGTDNGNGYGHISFKGKTTMAHRVSWELHNGKIPQGMFVCHRCDNPSCVNPKHLFLGTPTDNLKDAINKGRHFPPPPQKGEMNNKAKLTRKDVLKIKQLWVYTIKNQIEIAKIYGVCLSTIERIINKRSWVN